MFPQLRGVHFTAPGQQRGAIGLVAAITLGMALLFMLLVIDSGRLYLEQRKLQRVADMAALEAVTRGGSCATGTASTYVNNSASHNNFTPGGATTITPTCGILVTGADNLRTFKADANQSSAIRVIATKTVQTSVAGALWNLLNEQKIKLDTPLTASAVGTIAGAPLAMLSIRSSLLDINSANSSVLNALVGGLLGSTVNLSLASWQGLAATQINLLSYLDQLAIDVGATAGDYNNLLNSDLRLTQLLDAAIHVLEKNGPGATVALNGLKAIRAIASNTQLLKLGDLLNIQNGTPRAGLNANVTAFELLQGIVQLANGNNAATATLNTTIPLIGNATVYLKVIEPPQLSIAGNPALAKANPTGPNQIFVKTAQVQTRVHLDLAIVRTLKPLTDALTSVLSTVLEVVKKLLGLNVVEAVKCLVSCESTQLSIASALDVYVEAASASGYVTDYSCAADGSKSLTVSGSTSLAKVSIGQGSNTVAFPPQDADGNLIISPVKLITMDVKTCGLAGLICNTVEGKAGSFNVKASTRVGSATQNILYTSTLTAPATLPNMGLAPYYKNMGVTDIISRLGNGLAGHVETSYTPPPGKTVTGDLLNTVSTLVNQLIGTLTTAFKSLLAPLLDPIVNTLLKALGINLGNADIGANLSCNAGGRAQLVL
ncbi:pilus assembly protein TadG-related protein [Pseudomonas sp. SIMBA_077]